MNWLNQLKLGQLKEKIMGSSTTTTSGSFTLPLQYPTGVVYFSIDKLKLFTKITRDIYKTLTGNPATALDINRPRQYWVDPDYLGTAAKGPGDPAYEAEVTFNYVDQQTKSIQQYKQKAGWMGTPNIPADGWTLEGEKVVYISDDGKSAGSSNETPYPIRALTDNEYIGVFMGVVSVLLKDAPGNLQQSTPATSPTDAGTFTNDDRTKLNAIYQAIPLLLNK